MMSALIYGIRLQFSDGYPQQNAFGDLLSGAASFFAVMGGIFTSLMPEAKDTLIASMTVMGVSMGALIGVPPSLLEIYGTDIRKMYRAGEAPRFFRTDLAGDISLCSSDDHERTDPCDSSGGI